MTRFNRNAQLNLEAVETAHVFNRVVRRCFPLGDDEVTGKNYDHRKDWMEQLIELQAKFFAIDYVDLSCPCRNSRCS